jgi:hypothetical protein
MYRTTLSSDKSSWTASSSPGATGRRRSRSVRSSTFESDGGIAMARLRHPTLRVHAASRRCGSAAGKSGAGASEELDEPGGGRRRRERRSRADQCPRCFPCSPRALDDFLSRRRPWRSPVERAFQKGRAACHDQRRRWPPRPDCESTADRLVLERSRGFFDDPERTVSRGQEGVRGRGELGFRAGYRPQGFWRALLRARRRNQDRDEPHVSRAGLYTLGVRLRCRRLSRPVLDDLLGRGNVRSVRCGGGKALGTWKWIPPSSSFTEVRVEHALAYLARAGRFTAACWAHPGRVRSRRGSRSTSPASCCQAEISSSDHVPASLVAAKYRSRRVPI